MTIWGEDRSKNTEPKYLVNPMGDNRSVTGTQNTRKRVIRQSPELEGEGWPLLGSCQSRRKDFR